MEFSDVFEVPAPARFSIAGAFAMAVALASFLHAPDVVDATGVFGLVGNDKWIHAGSYALITFLLAYAVLARSLPVLAAIALTSILLGIGVEFIQSTIPWRSKEFADMVANSVGAVVAVGLWRVLWWYLPVTPPGGE